MEGKLERANQFIKEHRGTVKQKYRMSYHLMPEMGWCNDPNGFVYYNGRIHQFYQHSPYTPYDSWDQIYWGHATSKDFIKWEYLGVALAPDQSYESGCGCYSGSAVVKDGNLCLMYTGVQFDKAQQQCLAISTDGVHFEKYKGNPVITSAQAGEGCSIIDFRDPYVHKHGEYYYAILGTQSSGYGQLVLYRSKTLTSWEYVGKMMNNTDEKGRNFYQLDGVYECPTYAIIDGQPILICSPVNIPQRGNEFENIQSVIYMAGEIDYETGRFYYDQMREVDGGFDFYAAQMMNMPDGRVIITAWMDLWNRTYPTQEDGWCGSMILPRELSYKNGRLYQAPVREIENYRGNSVKQESLRLSNQSANVPGIAGDTLELSFKMKIESGSQCGVKVLKGGKNETLIYYDKAAQAVVLDRSKSGIVPCGKEKNGSNRRVSITPDAEGYISMRIFLDNIGCEVFINDGAATITAKIYAGEGDEGIEFYSQGGTTTFENIVQYEIVVKE